MRGHPTRALLVAAAPLLSGCLEVPGPPLGPEEPGDPPSLVGEPDAALAEPSLSCDEEFGGAAQYQLCAETESTCSFFSNTGESEFDCNQRCAESGSTCVTAFDAPGDGCITQSEDGCDYQHVSQICVCLRS